MTRFLILIATTLTLATSGCATDDIITTTTSTGPPTTTTTPAPTTVPTSSTTTTLAVTTTLDPIAITAADACEQLESIPLPESETRLVAIAAEAELPRLAMVEAMTSRCPDRLRTLDQLSAIAEQSHGLRQADLMDAIASDMSCENTRVAVTVANPYDSPIGLVLVLFVGEEAAFQKGVAILIPFLEPGETMRVGEPMDSRGVGCGARFTPFLATPNSSATDTWEPAAGREHLPDTTGSDWMQVLQALFDTDAVLWESGLFTEYGALEDVRSLEYSTLTSQTELREPYAAATILRVCDVLAVADDLALVAYQRTSSDGPHVTSIAAFRRSPDDDRWRWLQRSLVIDRDGSTCDIVRSLSVQR